MSAIDTLRDHKLTAESHFSYLTRDIDSQFSAVEIWGTEERDVLFREFYFIVDNTNERVYLADFKEPDVVFIAKIQRGLITAVKP